MAYTSHGHHIPGTDHRNAPLVVKDCGGFNCCSICIDNLTHYSEPIKSMPISQKSKAMIYVTPFGCNCICGGSYSSHPEHAYETAQNHLLETHGGHGDIFDFRGSATSRKEDDPCIYEEVKPRRVKACQLTTSYLDFIEFLDRFEFAFMFDNYRQISIIGKYNGILSSRYEKAVTIHRDSWLVVEGDSMPYVVSNDQFVRQFHKVNPE